ncbi:hypothetical protein PENTCL1PPCAC_11360, partial [Pristionchus entomophagus]
VLLPSTMESLLSQLSSPSTSLLPHSFLPPSLPPSDSSLLPPSSPDDLLRALDALPSSVSSGHSLFSPSIHAPTPIRPTPSLLSPHSYSSSLGSCGSLPLSSLSSSPSALSPLPTSLSSGSSAFSLLQLPYISDPFSLLENRRSSAPEGPPRTDSILIEKRRFSDFTSDGRDSSCELRRRHSMVPSSYGIAERKSSNPRKQRTIYAGGQTKVLEEAFLSQRYMVGTEREALASKLGLTEAQVRVWFQNRRSKHRKQSRTLSGSFDIPPSTTITSPTVLTCVSSTIPQLSIPSTSDQFSPSHISSLVPLFGSTLSSLEALSGLSSIQHLQMGD